ncbi:twin-arginine translocation pathway signal protein [Clostridia bacterium]|nr:twin-arginine translocation pathway signal protein [Clostridia bacterium]
MMIKFKKARYLVIMVAILTVITSGCGQSAAPGTGSGNNAANPADTGKILRISEASGGVIDPASGADLASATASVNMYDSLVYPNLDGEIVPSLAEDNWTVSDDGLVWDFTLRQGVKFHDGTELKASDVVFSVNRTLTLGEGYAYLFTGYLSGVEATGDYGVRFTLSKPFAPFLRILPRLYVLNEKLVMANIAEGSYGEFGDYGKAWLAEHDAGSGAYYCEAMRVQDRLIMKKYDEYFGEFEANAPDTVELISGTETATIRTLMSSGQLEISDQWQTNEAYTALDKIDGVELGAFSTGQTLYLMLNTTKAPTDDIHIRRAISHLIDYTQVTTVLFPGFHNADSPVPGNIPGHSSKLTPYEFSLDKAKEEIALSAYANRLNEVAVDIAWIAEVPDEEKLALLIQANAQQVGLKVNVVKVPWSTYVDNVVSAETTPNAGVCFMAADYDEAGSMLYQRFHSDTAGTWQQIEWLNDSAIDEEITTSLTTMDQTARFNIYDSIQKTVMDNVYGIAVADSVEKHAYYDYIVWPAMEKANRGEPVSALLGYNYLFRTFQVNK